MKPALKRITTLFFSGLLLLIPIVNELHFVLIEHDNTFASQQNKVIHHQCSDFFYHAVYLDKLPEEMVVPQWIDFENYLPIYSQQKDLIEGAFVLLNNKGPPHIHNPLISS